MSERTQIPAPRVPITDARTGLISREWYSYFFRVYQVTSIGQEFAQHVVETINSLTPDNSIWHLVCSGNLIISLQSFLDRDRVLTITNAGTGVITILAVPGEFINSNTQIELDFQWTTVQLCPRPGGYVII